MKKTWKLALITLCMLCLLTGCYEQDATISVGPLGGVKAEIAFAGNDEGIAQVSGGATYEELDERLVPQIEAMVTDVSKEKVERIAIDKEGGEYKGLKVTGYFSSVDEMYSSQLISVFNNSGMIPAPIVTNNAADGIGVMFNADKGFMGTTYTAEGNISMTQGNELDDEAKTAMSECKINIRFKFPVGAFTVSKGNKNILKPTFVYAATMENDNLPVSFKVFVPNYLAILGALIFIGLIVTIVLMAKKIKELNKIINGETEEEVAAEENGEFISEDDENFFEGAEESVEIEAAEPEEEVVEEIVIEETEEETKEEEKTEE